MQTYSDAEELPRSRAAAILAGALRAVSKIRAEPTCGDYSGEVTPVPIPNTEVKLPCADDTWRETAWESRTLPLFYLKKYQNILFITVERPFFMLQLNSL